MSDALFDQTEFTIDQLADPGLSAGQRRTIRARLSIAEGRHPANGEPIDADHRCGDCVNLQPRRGSQRTYFKCDFHRLGRSNCEASDIRASWPACPHYKAADR